MWPRAAPSKHASMVVLVVNVITAAVYFWAFMARPDTHASAVPDPT